MKNILKSLVVLTAVLSVVSYSTLAAFTAQATVTSSTFSTGNADLQLMINLAGSPTDVGNLSDSLAGPIFTNILPLSSFDYPAKLVNSGTVNLLASVSGIYVSDTSDLRTQINVEALAWNDANSNGVVDSGEVGSPYGAPMTLEQWRSAPINFGQLNVDGVLPVIFRFTAADLNDTYQGQTTVYDFQFNGTTAGATNPPVTSITPTPTP